jgi:hypothetical protein
MDYNRTPERISIRERIQTSRVWRHAGRETYFSNSSKGLAGPSAEILQALRETLPLTRAEAGVELLYQHACFSWMR